MGQITAITQDGTPNQTESTWFQPEVWNPNRQPATYPAANTPTQLRIITMGETFAQNEIDKDPATGQLFVGTPVNFGNDATAIYGDSASVQQGEVDFSNSTSYFSKPYELTTTSPGPRAAARTSTIPRRASPTHWSISQPIRPTYSSPSGPETCLAFSQLPRAPNRVQIKMDPYVTFLLEYQDPAGNWLPYSLVSRMDIIGTNSWGSGSGHNVGTSNWKEFARASRPPNGSLQRVGGRSDHCVCRAPRMGHWLHD